MLCLTLEAHAGEKRVQPQFWQQNYFVTSHADAQAVALYPVMPDSRVNLSKHLCPIVLA